MIYRKEEINYLIKKGELMSERKIEIDITNLEARMKLSIENKSGSSVDSAIKIMKAFNEVCEEIKKNELPKKGVL